MNIYSCNVVIFYALLFFTLLPQSQAESVTLFVAPNGNDSRTGQTEAEAFATLERARDALRQMNSTEQSKKKSNVPTKIIADQSLRGKVILLPGIYRRTRPFVLTQADSGVIYTAQDGAKVIISGAVELPPGKKVTGEDFLNRLPSEAKSHVLQYDLKHLGISDFGDFSINYEHEIQARVAHSDRQGEFILGSVPAPANSKSAGRLEVFFNSKPLQTARSPENNILTIKEILGKKFKNIGGYISCAEGIFRYDGNYPDRWKNEPNACVCGSWCRDWAEQRHKIETLDLKNHMISVRKPWHTYGYTKNQWFYGFNILAELDRPGEWYLDQTSGTLILWPLSITHSKNDDFLKVEISMASRLLEMNGTQNVTFKGITFEMCRNSAVAMKDCENCVIDSCVLRNLGQHGATIQDGHDNGVSFCEIYNNGGGGVYLVDNTRATLEPSRLFVRNCHIHHFGRWDRMYRPAIVMSGTGMIASHNHIHDAPHSAIIFGGNDHLIEFNDIHNVCYESNDCGAIYAGRAWILRGHNIRHNYLHQILGRGGRFCKGIYLDDSFAAATIYGNVFYQVSLAVFIGGGRDNVIDNNLFIDCAGAVFMDERGTGWQKRHLKGRIKEAEEEGTQWGIPFNKPPYSVKYPELKDLLDGNVYRPEGNQVTRNVFWMGTGEFIRRANREKEPNENWWDRIPAHTKSLVKMENNFINQDPGLVNFKSGNFRFKKDSPVFSLGIKTIPFEKIGVIP